MQFLSEITEQLLRRARIEQGMRVLDIGCGSGEVTRAIADIVGPLGTVIGVDGSAAALAAAETATDSTIYDNMLHSCTLPVLSFGSGEMSTEPSVSKAYCCIMRVSHDEITKIFRGLN